MINTPFTDAVDKMVSGADGSFTGPQIEGGGLPTVAGNSGSGGAGTPIQFAPVAHVSVQVPADLDESGYVMKQ